MQESTELESKSDSNDEAKLTRRIGWVCAECKCVTLEKERSRPKHCGSPDCTSQTFSEMTFVFGGPRNNWRKKK